MKIVYYSVECGILNQKSPDEIIINTENLTKALKHFRDEVKNQQSLQSPKTKDVVVTLIMNEIKEKSIKRSILMCASNIHYWVIEIR